MSSAHEPGRPDRLSFGRALPIFFIFFSWSFGSGAHELGRPLFAFQATGNVFMVSLLITAGASARLFGAPIAGYLSDRWGRRPMVVLGAGLRAGATLGQFWVTDYLPFLLLEFVGQAGVSIFITSSSVLMADVTTEGSRGRVMAVRTMSGRIGGIAGPLVGGALASVAGLRYIFLFNFFTKAAIVAVTLLLIAETRPARAAPVRERTGPATAAPAPASEKLDHAVFFSGTFLSLGTAAVSFAMMQQGIAQTLFPVHAQEAAGMSTLEVGNLFTLAALLTFVVALPNGVLSDRYGRKASLVPGLVVLGAGALALGLADSPAPVVVMAVAYGVGQGMTMGTLQVFAMDIAPVQHRGTFLGVWSVFRNAGSIAVPLIVGGAYDAVGPLAAFGGAAAWMLFSAALVAFVAKESHRAARGAAG